MRHHIGICLMPVCICNGVCVCVCVCVCLCLCLFVCVFMAVGGCWAFHCSFWRKCKALLRCGQSGNFHKSTLQCFYTVNFAASRLLRISIHSHLEKRVCALCRGAAQKFSNVNFVVTLYCKFRSELTFENFYTLPVGRASMEDVRAILCWHFRLRKCRALLQVCRLEFSKNVNQECQHSPYILHRCSSNWECIEILKSQLTTKFTI